MSTLANAGTNAKRSDIPIDKRKLEDDTSEQPMKRLPSQIFFYVLHCLLLFWDLVPTISREQALAIQRARTAKKWTQQQLAARISEPAKVINEYEQCKGIPNNAILSKLERVLGIKLHGL